MHELLLMLWHNGDQPVGEASKNKIDDAWIEFVRRFQPLVATVVINTIRRWIKPNRSTVEDLVQKTFLNLCCNNFSALRGFDCQNENAFRGFLKKVASHVAWDHIREIMSLKRGGGKIESLEQVGAAALATASPAKHIERQILLDEIDGCLQSLASGPNFARDCSIFWLYYRQGLTAKAISQLPSVGMTPKGVESILLRLTRLLRRKLKKKKGAGAAPGG